MERLEFSGNIAYNSIEACIHLNRYAFVRPFCNGSRILDAACGQGYGSYLMKTWGAKEVIGIDIDQESINVASQNFKSEGLSYIVHTAEQLPFENDSFDLIVSFETIEHVNHPECFLQEIQRVLRPGGTVILSCPNDIYYYQNDCAKNPFHKREYTFFQFKELAEAYLGTDADYYFAFALDGFINLPIDKCTEPDDGHCNDAFSLLRYESCSSALCVPQERYLNKWNANYYIGIWGPRNASYRISTVISPRETFIQHNDKDFDFLHHVEKLQLEWKEMFDNKTQLEAQLVQLYHGKELLQKQFDEQAADYARLIELLDIANVDRDKLQKQVDGQAIANARLTELLDLARRETEQLKQYVSDQTAYQNDLAMLQRQLDGQLMACARYTELLDLTRRECRQLQEYSAELERKMEHRFIIRVRRFLGRVLRKAKRVVKTALRR